MSLETKNSSKDTQAVLQLAAEQGAEKKDSKGAMERAGVKVKAVAQNHSKSVLKALQGSQLADKLNELTAQGKTDIIFDLRNEKDISDEEIVLLKKHRDALKLKGVKLTLIGIDEKKKQQLRSTGVADTNGLEVYTDDYTKDAFEKDEPADTPQLQNAA